MARRAAVIGVSLLVYLVVAALFVGILRSWTQPGGEGFAFGPRVAVVELEGIIVDTSDLIRDLQQHRTNPLVRAVVIRINSPGGVVAPTQELHTALVRLREAGKPVVASLGAVAASGGYYVAVAADRIYANPGTVTGSIGVIMQMANLENLFKKVGVDWVVVKSGQFKDIGNVARPMTLEERRLLQAVLDDVHGQFVAAIASGRKMDRAQRRDHGRRPDLLGCPSEGQPDDRRARWPGGCLERRRFAGWLAESASPSASPAPFFDLGVCP